jgi:hypothetical protein
MAEFGAEKENPENKDVMLALAIASGSSASEASRNLDIPLRTVQRRMADPDFRRFVSDLRAQMLQRALGHLTENMTKAAGAMTGLLDSPEPAIRLRAARSMLTLGLRLHDAVDVAERIREVEAELARRKAGYS